MAAGAWVPAALLLGAHRGNWTLWSGVTEDLLRDLPDLAPVVHEAVEQAAAGLGIAARGGVAAATWLGGFALQALSLAAPRLRLLAWRGWGLFRTALNAGAAALAALLEARRRRRGARGGGAAAGPGPWPGAMAAAGGHVPGFQLLARREQWDEALLLARVGDGPLVVALSTTPDGAQFCWWCVDSGRGHMRTPLGGAGGARRPPVGVRGESINWVCLPPDAGDVWQPALEEIAGLREDALQLARLWAQRPPPAARRAVPGADLGHFPHVVELGGALGPEAPDWAGALPVAEDAGGEPAAGAEAAAAGPGQLGGVAGGLGFPGAAEGLPPNMGLAEMQRAVEDIRTEMAAGRLPVPPTGSKDKKRERHGDGRRRRRSTGRRRRSRESSRRSSRRSGGSRSGSARRRRRRRGSRSSSGSSSFVRWKHRGSSRSLSPRQVTRFAGHKFRDQSDVISFAAQHPGALTAFFLGMVHQKLHQGLVRNTRDFRRTSVLSWVERHSGLAEVRDVREAVTLATAMDLMNQGQYAELMDVLAQRLSALQAAKAKGGSWEKAAKIELTIPPGQAAAPSGLLRLTT